MSFNPTNSQNQRHAPMQHSKTIELIRVYSIRILRVRRFKRVLYKRVHYLSPASRASSRCMFSSRPNRSSSPSDKRKMQRRETRTQQERFEHDNYELGMYLSSGACGTVMMCHKRGKPSKKFVCKYMDTSLLSDKLR